MSASQPGSSGGTQTVERAIGILNLFREGPAHRSLSSIAKECGLNVSTTHRLVRTLVEGGLMEQDRESEKYRLGPTLALLGHRAMSTAGLADAQPILDALAAEVGETVSLASRTGPSATVLLMAGGGHGLRFEHPLGAPIEIHASAMGKVLLAFGARDGGTDDLAGLGPLTRFTDTTITTTEGLLEELQAVRAFAMAVNRQERHPGVCGVAVPVRDARATVRYALGIQGPSVRLNDERMAELARTAARAADQLGRLSAVAG